MELEDQQAGRRSKIAFLTVLVPYRDGPGPEVVEASVSAKGGTRLFRVKVGPDARSLGVDFDQQTAMFR